MLDRGVKFTALPQLCLHTTC